MPLSETRFMEWAKEHSTLYASQQIRVADGFVRITFTVYETGYYEVRVGKNIHHGSDGLAEAIACYNKLVDQYE